jgi:hypothetical protein
MSDTFERMKADQKKIKRIGVMMALQKLEDVPASVRTFVEAELAVLQEKDKGRYVTVTTEEERVGQLTEIRLLIKEGEPFDFVGSKNVSEQENYLAFLRNEFPGWKFTPETEEYFGGWGVGNTTRQIICAEPASATTTQPEK